MLLIDYFDPRSRTDRSSLIQPQFEVQLVPRTRESLIETGWGKPSAGLDAEREGAAWEGGPSSAALKKTGRVLYNQNE